MKLAAARSRARKARFLQAFKRYKIVTVAARRVGLSRQSVYRWASEDEKFREDFMNLVEELTDEFEAELVKLATGHYKKPLVSAGAIVGYEDIRSETALLALLNAYRPRLYSRRQNLQITGGDGGPVVVVKKAITATLIADVTKLLAEAGVGIPDSERPALSAASEEQPAASAMLDLRSRRQP